MNLDMQIYLRKKVKIFAFTAKCFLIKSHYEFTARRELIVNN